MHNAIQFSMNSQSQFAGMQLAPDELLPDPALPQCVLVTVYWGLHFI